MSIESPRPEDGSPEDLAHSARCADLRAALVRVGENMLPGSPYLEDELRARGTFAKLVASGMSCAEALEEVWRRFAVGAGTGG